MMFVRWKRRKKTYKRPWQHEHKGEIYLSAYLVENKRIDGKVKQKVIKYLGSIHQDKTQFVGFASGFWAAANRALSELNLEESEVQAIKDKLAETIMLDTPEAWAEALKNVTV